MKNQTNDLFPFLQTPFGACVWCAMLFLWLAAFLYLVCYVMLYRRHLRDPIHHKFVRWMIILLLLDTSQLAILMYAAAVVDGWAWLCWEWKAGAAIALLVTLIAIITS
jgi:hypothetical protein